MVLTIRTKFHLHIDQGAMLKIVALFFIIKKYPEIKNSLSR